MLYHINLLSLTAFILLSCKNQYPYSSSQIGTDISNTESSTVSDQGASVYYYYDKQSNRINLLNQETSDISFSQDLSQYRETDDDTWFVAFAAKVLLRVANKQVLLVRDDGSSQTIHTFAGSVKSYSKSSDDLYFVFVDEFNSILLVSFDESSNFVGSWISGSLVEGSATINSGEILSDGTFLVSLSNGNLSRVNISESITNQAWVKSDIDFGVDSISWIGQVNETGERALLFSSSLRKAYLTNTVSGEILQEENFSSGNITLSKKGTHHIVIQEGQQVKVIRGSSGSQWQEFSLTTTSTYSFQSSRLNDSYFLISVNSPAQFYKIRLSDALVQNQVQVDSYDKFYLTTEYVILTKDLPLGYVNFVNFSDQEEKVISGFNLDVFQN